MFSKRYELSKYYFGELKTGRVLNGRSSFYNTLFGFLIICFGDADATTAGRPTPMTTICKKGRRKRGRDISVPPLL
jgi:hypothetical protein